MVFNFRVFKKQSPNGKITIYLGKRDFVDHISGIEPIGEQILIFDNTSSMNTSSMNISITESQRILLNYHNLHTSFDNIEIIRNENTSLHYLQTLNARNKNNLPLSSYTHSNESNETRKAPTLTFGVSFNSYRIWKIERLLK